MIVEIYSPNHCYMKTFLKHPKVADIICGIFIVLFTYTAVNKLVDYQTFRIALVQSPILEHYAGFMMVALPVVELLVVLLLAIPATRRVGLFASLFLMTAFTLYISYLMFFASELPCNCGGIMRSLSWKQHLIVNIFLIALAGWAILITRTNKNIIVINRNSQANFN